MFGHQVFPDSDDANALSEGPEHPVCRLASAWVNRWSDNDYDLQRHVFQFGNRDQDDGDGEICWAHRQVFLTWKRLASGTSTRPP